MHFVIKREIVAANMNGCICSWKKKRGEEYETVFCTVLVQGSYNGKIPPGKGSWDVEVGRGVYSMACCTEDILSPGTCSIKHNPIVQFSGFPGFSVVF